VSGAPAMDGTAAAVPARPRRIVFAAILADEAILASLDNASALAEGADRPGLASMPLRFIEHAGTWSAAATLAIGVSPPRHGVLTAAAIDEDSLLPRLRRTSDADRPWIWDRLAAEGSSTAVVGWPGIGDAENAKVPLATFAAIMAPWRLASLAEGATPARIPPAGRGPEAGPMLAQLVAPTAAAPAVARAAIEAATGARPGDAEGGLSRMLGMILATAAALEGHASGGPDRPRLWAIGVPLRSEPPREADADATPDEGGGDGDESIARGRSMLFAAIRMLADAAGEDGVLLAAALGTRSGRLWHTTRSTAPLAAAIDLAPTILQLAGLPVSADLAGDSLLGKVEETAKSWDIARWSLPDADPAAGSPRPAAGTLARKALAAWAGRKTRPEGEPPAAIEGLLSRHFEAEWAIALSQPDWTAALAAANALVELQGREIDLWRVAFAAFQGDRSEAGEEAAAKLRAEHPEALSTRLLPLLSTGQPPTELVESIDLAELRVPTQRSIVGRAAAKLGLDDRCRAALGPLIAQGLAIPADRIALASTLLQLGEGSRAVAALGGIGLGAESPGRLRMLRARCLAAAGMRDRAIALLERHVALSPFESEAKTLLAKLRLERDAGA
jgi:hypothetical protein